MLAYFNEHVVPLLRTMSMREPNALFIEDRKLYLVFTLSRKGHGTDRVVLVNVPSVELGRFITLPTTKDRTDLLYLDDAIRLGAPRYFKGWTVKAGHAIKLTRCGAILDEEFTENVADKVRRSLRKRNTGVPARFLYDSAMPRIPLDRVCKLLEVRGYASGWTLP